MPSISQARSLVYVFKVLSVNYLRAFSTYLDQMVAGKLFSSTGIIFLKNSKKTPPFLGISHDKPILSFEHEIILAEFFYALSFKENNRIKGGLYYCTTGDNPEIVAKKVYKSMKYVTLVNRITFPNGETILLPYLNLDDLSQSSEYISDLISKANDKEKMVTLLQEYNLPKHESIQLLRMIYNAAQKTLLNKAAEHR